MKILISILFSIGKFFLTSYIFLCMYNWFLVVLGAPEITYPHAFGLLSFFSIMQIGSVTYLLAEDVERPKENQIKPINLHSVSLFIWLMIWAEGAIIHYWFM